MAAESPYQLVRKLAAGGTSEVHLARVPGTSVGAGVAPHEVVLKTLFRHFTAQPALAAMFRHEAWVLSRLDHPTIPRLHAFEPGGVELSMALEYVPGPSLAELLKRGALPLPAAVALVADLLAGLAHAHSRTDAHGEPLGIVHRDVTPANVIVTPGGDVKLIDFGISTSVARVVEGGSAAGSLGYIAPEVIAGDAPVDRRADLFAAGALLYEATLGEKAFPGNALAVMHAVTEGSYTAPTARDPRYPTALAEVVTRALSRDPEQRYPDGESMARALLAAAQSAGITPSHDALAEAVRALRP